MRSKPIFAVIFGMAGPALYSVILFALLNISSCASAPPKLVEEVTPQKIVMISVDGLRPEFYQSDAYDTPTLKFLAKLGASSRGTIPIYPSVTYPNHTTLVTGVRSAKHGVYSNTVFDFENGSTTNWYWEKKFIKVPTLWDAAKKAGKTTAIFSWPVSVGAEVDWLIPEIFPANNFDPIFTWELTRRNMSEKTITTLAELITSRDEKPAKTFVERDQWLADAAVKVIREHQPDLTLIHFGNVDHMSHGHGRNSKEAKNAIAQLDSQIKQVLGAVDLATTLVLIVGDHGFWDYTRELDVNSLFVKRGWQRLRNGKIADDWKVVAHPGGAQAAIFVRDKKIEGEVLKVLRDHADGIYDVLDRKKLDELEAFPGALCAVDPHQGYSMSYTPNGVLVKALGKTKGQHGYLATNRPMLYTGFIATGAGAEPGRDLGLIDITNIAPTAARLLKLELPDAEGKPLVLSTAK